MLEAIFTGGSREASRKRRGLDTDDVLDAEVVDDDELDLPDLPGLDIGQEPEEVAEGTAESWDYRDDRDRSVGGVLEPEPVIHYGAAGKATKFIPPNNAMGETEHEHHVRVEANKKKAEEKLKKRKLPEEIAAERKAHKEAMRDGLKKRKYFQNQGQSSIPEALDGEVEANEDGSVTVRFDRPKE